MKADSDTRLVYSTGIGPVCPDCGRQKNNCICRQLKRKVLPESSGGVRIRFETASRKGKGVTLITGLPLAEDALLELARKLKQQFATGGSVKGYVIELQGDQREKIRETLVKLGYIGQSTESKKGVK